MSHEGFVDHCLELLAPLGRVRARRMFGGHGVYIDDLFVALIAAERLYLKAGPETSDRFAAAGGQPFTYARDGKTASLGFWTAPDEAMDSPELMRPWGWLAMQAAVAARAVPAAARKARAARVRR